MNQPVLCPNKACAVCSGDNAVGGKTGWDLFIMRQVERHFGDTCAKESPSEVSLQNLRTQTNVSKNRQKRPDEYLVALQTLNA